MFTIMFVPGGQSGSYETHLSCPQYARSERLASDKLK